MERVKQLRQKAELFRRVARIPAGRDPLADRELSVLAERLDPQASEREEHRNANLIASLSTARPTAPQTGNR